MVRIAFLSLSVITAKLLKFKYKYFLLFATFIGSAWIFVVFSSSPRKRPKELMLDVNMVVGEIETDVVNKYFDKRDEKLRRKESKWTNKDEIELNALRKAYESVVTSQRNR